MRHGIGGIWRATAILAVALCAAANGFGLENTGADKLQATAGTVMKKGLDWLKGRQKEDGSWSNGNYPAMTALGLWAFARSDHPDKAPVCARAADFVAGFVRDDGGIYKPATHGRGSGGLSTYNTAICMTALHAYDRQKYAGLILKAREFMAGSQLEGDSPGAGGFGYEGKGGRADLSNTGWSLMAMRYTQDMEDMRPAGQKRVDVEWAAAVEFIEKLQDKDRDDPRNYGGFGYEPGAARGGITVGEKDGAVKLRGFGSMTYAALESMIYADVDRKDPRVQSALEWAARHWSVDENPGMGTAGLFYYYNVMGKALSVSGLNELARPEGGDPIAWKKEIVEKLAAVQNPDGSWSNSNNQFWEGDPTLVTAYSVLALQYAVGK